MHTSRRPPRDARRFAPQSRVVVHGQMAWNRMEMGIRAPRDRNVDVFDEHRESTNGNISAALLLMSQGDACISPDADLAAE